MLDVPVECLFVQQHMPFRQTLLYVDRYMHRLALHEPFMPVAYMSDTITPLDQAIVIEGAKTFEERFMTIHPNAVQQYEEAATNPSWLQLFQHFLHEFDYESAIDMLEPLPNATHIRDLLYVQLHRLNFHFDEAHRLIQQMDLNDATLQKTSSILQQLIAPPSSEQALAEITELYRHIYVTLQKEDWSSFLIRFYRAREAVIHYLLIYAAYESKPKHNEPLFKQIEKLEDAYESGDANDHYGTYFYIKSANVVNALNVRNQSVIGHSRAPIDPKLLFINYYGTSAKSSQMPERFLADTRIMLRDLGSALDDNMLELNDFIFEQMAHYLQEEHS
ncbi:hypothetical protein [Caryophanon latum]|uniref:Uncharacterized protein n=1 Tax=Caryophanon latum TaxID=33977 RepID=A0A1C0Y6N5_9BACL|nr:hypothetical protein [Caryophanon latum]OCS82795.1 hypothetical protein A6K76_16270 [Caryophanon latum]